MPARAKSLDKVVYPAQDDMGEHELQRFIAELLRPLLERWFREKGVIAHAGADTFFYFQKGDAKKRLAPDVYVLLGVRQDLAVPSWKLWEGAPAPHFALEVVSRDVSKDYDKSPALFDAIGGNELVLFDPEARATSKRRFRWTVYRRGPDGMRLVEQTHADRVRSEALGGHLRTVGEGASLRVRLASGPEGNELFPTDAEAHLAAESERDAARAELERVRAELEALRRSSG